MLLTAASLNSAYASIFTKNQDQARKLSSKALDYALSVACLANKRACGAKSLNYGNFTQAIASFNKTQRASLYVLDATWGSYIETNSDNWNAIAEISRVQRIMERVVELDEQYKFATAHIYLGTMATLLPPAL